MNLRILLPVGAAIWLGACASAPKSTSDTATATATPRRDASVLTRAELEGSAGRTLYDHIRRVRPQWLSTRGPTTIQGAGSAIIVYRDGVRIGTVSALQDITTDFVESVRYLSGPEASGRYGLDHQNGAIMVTTRK